MEKNNSTSNYIPSFLKNSNKSRNITANVNGNGSNKIKTIKNIVFVVLLVILINFYGT